MMTGKPIQKDMVKFWGMLFGINSAYYSHYVGDNFGAPTSIPVHWVPGDTPSNARPPDRHGQPVPVIAERLRIQGRLLRQDSFPPCNDTPHLPRQDDMTGWTMKL